MPSPNLKTNPRPTARVAKTNGAQMAAPSSAPTTPAAAEVVSDYRLAFQSRQVSLIGRREVMSGKAKFGIFGDGKELAQLALAKACRPGDFRSGYYRDQTLMLALNALALPQFFAQLYAHADVEAEPVTAGRSMNAHFGTRLLNADGAWKNLMAQFNSATDVSPTASQMPRLVGLGYASRLYRELEELRGFTQFSRNGDEVAFGTVGNASSSEGLFWESVNAIGVLRVPVVLSIWDDEYGISVHNEHQMVKQNLSALLQGFQRAPNTREGMDIYTVRGWDYPALVDVYRRATDIARREHIPSVIHVVELTQPQGHSTSGSHERYKSKARLEWEAEFDCVRQFRQWIVAEALAPEKELEAIEREERLRVEVARKQAWEAYAQPIEQESHEVADILDEILPHTAHTVKLTQLRDHLRGQQTPLRREITSAIREALLTLKDEPIPTKQVLIAWQQRLEPQQHDRYNSHLYSQSAASPLRVPVIPPLYIPDAPVAHGFEIVNACFDAMLKRDPRVIAFGEDVGQLGDVNQGFSGLQAKYGALRVSDTGIREATIIGQAIGLAMRGLRPIAEIQYLDYLLYALQILSDDVATLRWRTKGGQHAPLIVRTRGHRLEGIWHSGSLMAGVIHFLRGMHVLVPRNMTQAAGFYNTLLLGDDPALVVEVLNGYRLKETVPHNIGEFTVPLGVPEVLRAGEDVTVVTYGACCRIALEAAKRLETVGVSAEIIDVQSLLPFDRVGRILESLKKTSRILFVDEDVPGGTTAYMLQEVIEKHGGYAWLDSPPRTLSGQAHRPAYGSDGDYWSKPQVEHIFDAVYEMMHEVSPSRYPMFYR